MSRALWLISVVAFAGCLSTRPEQWGASGEDPTLKRAIYECKSDVDRKLGFAANFGGAVVPIAAMIRAPGHFNDCMESKGYKRAE